MQDLLGPDTGLLEAWTPWMVSRGSDRRSRDLTHDLLALGRRPARLSLLPGAVGPAWRECSRSEEVRGARSEAASFGPHHRMGELRGQ
jgi:hypothetical protein